MNNVITNANGVKVKVRVYDFGDKTADRYTIVCVSGRVMIIIMSLITRYLVVARTRFILKE